KDKICELIKNKLKEIHKEDPAINSDSATEPIEEGNLNGEEKPCCNECLICFADEKEFYNHIENSHPRKGRPQIVSKYAHDYINVTPENDQPNIKVISAANKI